MEGVPRLVSESEDSGESSWRRQPWQYEVAFPSRSGTHTMAWKKLIEVPASSHKQFLWDIFFGDQINHTEDTVKDWPAPNKEES